MKHYPKLYFWQSDSYIHLGKTEKACLDEVAVAIRTLNDMKHKSKSKKIQFSEVAKLVNDKRKKQKRSGMNSQAVNKNLLLLATASQKKGREPMIRIKTRPYFKLPYRIFKYIDVRK